MMEPTIKGWVWNISFYPNFGVARTLSDIFWYDSSNEMEFTKHTSELQIIIPEHLLDATPEQLKYVHENKDEIIKSKRYIVWSAGDGRWVVDLTMDFND